MILALVRPLLRAWFRGYTWVQFTEITQLLLEDHLTDGVLSDREARWALSLTLRLANRASLC